MNAIHKATGERGAAFVDDAGFWHFVSRRAGSPIDSVVDRSEIVLLPGDGVFKPATSDTTKRGERR